MKKKIFIAISIICAVLIIVLILYTQKSHRKIIKTNNLVLSTGKYDNNSNKGLKEFIKWHNSANPPVAETVGLVKKYKKQLWNINIEYKRRMGISLFDIIYSSYVDNWASAKLIASFLNFWIAEIERNDYQQLINQYYSPPTTNAFIWNIKVNNRKAIKSLPPMLSNYMEKVKKKYLEYNTKKFFKWIKNKIYSADKGTQDINYILLEAVSVENKNYNEAINANILLVNKLEKNLGTLQNRMIYIANIARYSVLENKVNIRTRNCILNYMNFLNQYIEAKDEFDKDIKQQCINDVIKKYDLLHGKPKDGYYYPVNDMKIKVESD